MNLQGRDLKLDLRGDDVALLHRELATIGLSVPDAERRETLFGRGTHEAVAHFQKQHCMEPTGVVDAETARAINAAADAMTFTVRGKVVSRLRAGVGGLRVEIVDKNVGNDVQLANAATDDEGGYCATFNVMDLRQRGKRRPDLQARVSAGRTFLGASKVCYNASNRETLNILLTEQAASALPSEHETLTGALSAHFGGSLRDLQEADERQDITYLANKTGWDARAVALAALADQFSARTMGPEGGPQIEAPLFYALFRAGVPANEGALYQITAKNAADIWKQAIRRGVIATNLERRVLQAAKQFQRIAVERTLDGPALAGVSSLKDMLTVSLGDDLAGHKRFTELYTQHRNDPVTLWEAVRGELGEAAEKRLRLDGQLGYLTINNAPLIRKLHAAGGQTGLTDTVSLAEQGYYRAEKWRGLIGDGPIPSEVPGETNEEKRTRYADVLAAQVRLSFPTMVVAQMVKEGETPVSPERRAHVHAFLAEHQGKFEIGMQPVQRYIARNQLQVPNEVSKEVSRIQRVYQITPSDDAMNALLKRGVDSALAVSRYDRDQFVRRFQDELGGEANARLTHAKAQQVHNIVLNLATSYLVARTAPQIGEHSPAKYGSTKPQLIQEAQNQAMNIMEYLAQFGGESPDNAADVIPYATLEALFGEMDYCACEHCRSVLSPAAYLVDLLQFLDRDDQGTDKNPLNILLGRRPDIQHLPLTCENTNTPVPYIDLVNEKLEYYITHNLSLAAYQGHSTDDAVTPEELLASPQFVEDVAYMTLAGTHFPPPLPFHQPLANLRRYFDKFEMSLPEVMEELRKNDDLERANDDEYGWRDILMEELKLSRAEYRLLTDRQLTIQQIYGYEPGEPIEEVLYGRPAEPATETSAEIPAKLGLSNAKAFTRRMGISYEEIVEILKTRFVNPNSTLVPKLEKLGVPFIILKAFKEGTIGANDLATFEANIAGLDASKYDGDIKEWVKNDANYARIMGLVTLTDPTGEDNPCSFDKVEFRYTVPVDPGDSNPPNRLRPFEFYRLIRFIRLWKKLGWTIEQTDKAITALYPADQKLDNADDQVNLQNLDTGFLTLLARLGVLRRVMRALKLKPKKDLLPLLACFAPIDTHGAASLYRQMFLYPAPSEEGNPFADDGYGTYLPDGVTLTQSAEALRAAFLLTGDELSEIIAALEFTDQTTLTLDDISAIFRRGWLARKLKLSVREFRLLTQFIGIDPFVPPDPPDPPGRPEGPAILGVIELVSRLRAASLKPEQALYLIWNQDISGKSAPDIGEILDFARTLRAAFAAIESEFALTDDPNGQIARARMALVYGNDATNFFFGLLDNTFVSEVPYDHDQASLEQPILNAAPGRIAYDDFGKRLSFTGVMTEDALFALKVGVPVAFENAVDSLYEENRKVVEPFFDRYQELRALYNAYAGSTEPVEKKRSDLLANFLPELKYRRKRQQALAAISAAAKADIASASALLDDKTVLNPAAAAAFPTLVDAPALDDLKATETAGLSARFYAGTTVGGPGVQPDHISDAEANLAYSTNGGATLPFSPASGLWSGYLEAPENGFYKFSIEPGGAGGAGAGTATLTLNGEDKPLEKNGEVWSNTTAIELRAGTLYPITLEVENITAGLKVRWETKGRGWEVIPAVYLYPETLTGHLRATYVRFLKATSLAAGLKLKPSEMAYFAAHPDYRIGERGWLNSLPVAGSPDAATSTALLKAFQALLDFAGLKAKLAPNDERLLAVLKDPNATIETTDETPEEDKQSLLLALTRWNAASLDALLLRFGKHLQAQPDQADRAALKDLGTFLRVYRAYAPVKKIGVSASALVAATTNEPQAPAVRTFKTALRARYEEGDWLNELRPINDEMRSLQRDALVAYILHQMRADPVSEHIDTPEKLFEYFLMDVQMDPCMQTSRIRHALSSIQLFIERCFMNLETEVVPSIFEPKHRKQWEWMKRYRVWEANRKVLLWPENWVEPELRGDQSPFFKEAMSELLQSDITEDRAATALLNYLSKLEEVAKLEPCGIHFVEGDAGTADDIPHVVARTAGASRKYFYRRQESGLWTPWEEIKLDIEDNPVTPVVWKDRLFLLWLKILKQADGQIPQNSNPPQNKSGEDKSVGECTPNDLKTDAQETAKNTKVTVQALLCWSEYYNGKWQPTKTSDINRPVTLRPFSLTEPNTFDILTLPVFETASGALRIFVGDSFESWSSLLASFLLYNTHSVPEPEDTPPFDDVWEHYVTNNRPHRSLRTVSDSLDIMYYKGGSSDALIHPVLKNKIGASTSEPRHKLQKPWEAPFFYEDRRHVFYVTTQKVFVPVQQSLLYYGAGESVLDASITPVIMPELQPPGPGPYEFALIGSENPSSMKRFFSEDAYIKKGIPMTSTVRLDGAEIGPAGGIVNAVQKL